MAYDHKLIEKKWNEIWEKKGIYNYKKSILRNETYVIDTPPPTVSGSLHIGHIFSYTQTDIQVRFKRMMGYNIFYPIGWDDNGLPTERRVQNYFGIKCDPTKTYDENFKPCHVENSKNQDIKEISRSNFIEACDILANDDEKIFEKVFRSIGHSYDWSFKYATIDENSRKIAQLSFLDLVQKKLAYTKEIPTMWDITFQSAVANAEIEDREMPSKFYDIEFQTKNGEKFIISTTRPELLPACIAIVANPNDERYKHLFGQTAISPAFFAEIPICPAEHVIEDKGTGIMMICTFGDIQDVEWWKQSGLPMKQIINKKGQIIDLTYGSGVFSSINKEKAKTNYDKLIGLHIKKARAKIIEILTEENAIRSARDIVHNVKFYEKGDQPIEFIPSRQWFIDIINHKEELIAQGKKINWYPSYMQSRYEHWVNGINQDWCISRQRFFGVPFPLWYKLDENGKIDYDNPIFPEISDLPIDPMISVPRGYSENDRNQPNGFTAEKDIMDTWATSSLTPQIAAKWKINDELFNNVFPMDLRTQSHDIIRTWAFYTIVKSWYHEKQIPWKNIAISGFIVDPDRKKMSKSKGNVITPEHLIEEYSADAVRYWAGRAKLGVDTIYDEKVFKIGKKLVTKIFNAGNFVKTILDKSNLSYDLLTLDKISEKTDLYFIEIIKLLTESATEHLNKYEYSDALQETEDVFWKFCDYYIELTKKRAYQEENSYEKISALATLYNIFNVFLKLFAPFMPYITDEMYSIFNENRESIHIESWPRFENDFADENNSKLALKIIENVMSEIRSAKTKEQKNMLWPVENFSISGRDEYVTILKEIFSDIAKSSSINENNAKILISDQENENSAMFEIQIQLSENN